MGLPIENPLDIGEGKLDAFTKTPSQQPTKYETLVRKRAPPCERAILGITRAADIRGDHRAGQFDHYRLARRGIARNWTGGFDKRCLSDGGPRVRYPSPSSGESIRELTSSIRARRQV